MTPEPDASPTLHARLEAAMRDAMRARDERRTTTLRMALAAAHNQRIARGRELTDEEVTDVIGREVKQRRESIDVYRGAGRDADAVDELRRAHDALTQALADLSDEQRRGAIDRVPEHRRIVATWDANRPREVTLKMAGTRAPTGRPLRDEERVAVTLTIHPGGRGDSTARRDELLRVLEGAAAQGALPTVGDLAELVGVSVATVRRDLVALRASGHPIRTRGNRAG
jgi:uncharacterized protein